MSNRPFSAAVSTACVLCAVVGLAEPARAALGGSPMPTPSDATTTTLAPTAHTAATLRNAPSAASAAAASISVRSTVYSSGTQVREYVGADGKVFGIAWNGPRMPDLQSLLGNYFPQYASGVQAQRAARHARGPVAVEQSDLIVHSGGHMGSFFGQAWLPSALPGGLTGADIK